MNNNEWYHSNCITAEFNTAEINSQQVLNFFSIEKSAVTQIACSFLRESLHIPHLGVTKTWISYTNPLPSFPLPLQFFTHLSLTNWIPPPPICLIPRNNIPMNSVRKKKKPRTYVSHDPTLASPPSRPRSDTPNNHPLPLSPHTKKDLGFGDFFLLWEISFVMR